MNWKRFLRPTHGKLILTTIIFLLLPAILVRTQCLCKTGVSCQCPALPLPAVLVLFSMLIEKESVNVVLSIVSLIGALVAYLIASVLVTVKRVLLQPKIKRGLVFNLKPSKGRLILGLVGSISLLAFIYHQEILYMVLLPLTLISQGLLMTQGVILQLMTFYGLPNLFQGFPAYYNLTIFGKAILIPLIILEWYIISCVGFYLYRKLKQSLR